MNHTIPSQVRNYFPITTTYVNPLYALAGRWTSEEHNLFLQGLHLYSKQWKLIADLVKTRTVVQIRTHAQKYFQKLEKGKVSGLKKDGLSMEVGY